MPDYNRDDVPKNIDITEVLDTIRRNYAGVRGVQRTETGSLNLSYKVHGSSGIMGVAKFHNPLKAFGQIKLENEFCRAMFEAGVPTPEIVRAKNGEDIVKTTFGPVTMYLTMNRFCDGLPYSYQNTQLVGAALMQVRMHGVDFKDILKVHDEPDFLDDINPLLARAKQVIESGVNTFGSLEKAVAHIGARKAVTSSPKSIIHGDYHSDDHADNLRFTPDGRVSGIFDFDFVAPGRNLYDLAISLTYFARKPDGQFDEKVAATNIQKYLGAYCELAPLGKEDLALLPYLMIVRGVDNLSRDLRGKGPAHQLIFSNRRNITLLNWALNLDLNGGVK